MNPSPAVVALSPTNAHWPWRGALAVWIGLAVVLAWDASGLDVALAHLSGGPEGFPLAHHWLLTTVLHDGARRLSGVLLAALALVAVRPLGPFRDLDAGRRLWLLLVVAGAMLLVSMDKRLSASSCPWDLVGFGGTHPYVPHWLPGRSDGGPGHCFPAGHASAGFAWLGGVFAWPARSRAARRWIATTLSAGLVLGVGQQLRGAHFLSHTLWTAWLCWTWGWMMSAWLPRPHHARATG